MLAVVGPGAGPWLLLHKATFILWFGVMTIHVLNYAPQLPRLLAPRPAGRGGPVPGAAMRWLGLAVSLAIGIGVAAVTMQLSAKWGVSF